MENNEIKSRIITIIDEVVQIDNLSLPEKTAIIGSDSIKALLFLTAIEEEFEVEIDDDYINSSFFFDMEYIVNCIENVMNN